MFIYTSCKYDTSAPFVRRMGWVRIVPVLIENYDNHAILWLNVGGLWVCTDSRPNQNTGKVGFYFWSIKTFSFRNKSGSSSTQVTITRETSTDLSDPVFQWWTEHDVAKLVLSTYHLHNAPESKLMISIKMWSLSTMMCVQLYQNFSNQKSAGFKLNWRNKQLTKTI